jgi:hypothetical protein
MKGIKTVSRGSDSTTLEFTSKQGTGYITFNGDGFVSSHDIVTYTPPVTEIVGVFNGTTSFLNFEGLSSTFTSSADNIKVSFSLRTPTPPSGPPYGIFDIISGTSPITGGWNTPTQLTFDTAGSDFQVNTVANPGLLYYETYDLADGDWHDVVFEIGLATAVDTLNIDGTDYNYSTGAAGGSGAPTWGSHYGGTNISFIFGRAASGYLNGEMKNLKVEVGSAVLIDCADVVVGTNAGLLNDATVTDVVEA